MKKISELLKEKIKSLEGQLKQRESLLKKYQEALNSSNTRIERIAKDLDESLSLIRDIHKTLLLSDCLTFPALNLAINSCQQNKV